MFRLHGYGYETPRRRLQVVAGLTVCNGTRGGSRYRYRAPSLDARRQRMRMRDVLTVIATQTCCIPGSEILRSSDDVFSEFCRVRLL